MQQVELAEHEAPDARWTLLTFTPRQGWATPNVGRWVRRVREWMRELASGMGLACFIRVEAACKGETPPERAVPCVCRSEAQGLTDCFICGGGGTIWAAHIHVHAMVRGPDVLTPHGVVRLSDKHQKVRRKRLLDALVEELDILPGPGVQIDHLRAPTAYAAKYATKRSDAAYAWASLRREGIMRCWSTCGAAHGLAGSRVTGTLVQAVACVEPDMASDENLTPQPTPAIRVVPLRRRFAGLDLAEGGNVPRTSPPRRGGDSETTGGRVAGRPRAVGRFTVTPTGEGGVEVMRHTKTGVRITQYVPPPGAGSAPLSIGDALGRAAWNVVGLILPGWVPPERVAEAARGWAQERLTPRTTQARRRLARSVFQAVGHGYAVTLAELRRELKEQLGIDSVCEGLRRALGRP